MAKLMKSAAAILSLFTGLAVLFYCNTKDGLLLTLAITFGTTAYHFVMRLMVGTMVNARMHNRTDPYQKWYRPLPFEGKVYRLLRVHGWKNTMLSYDPALFSTELHSLYEIAQAMCQAEVVHTIIFFLSFLPLLMIFPFGEPLVFLLTSIAAAAVDGAYVIMQRYNRPRILRLWERQQKQGKKRNP
ncbi:MAG: hypothetical protein E7328_00610 [Clostridiales bacterium]|nr:hypothetical protein [Clostridiales bacterium]